MAHHLPQGGHRPLRSSIARCTTLRSSRSRATATDAASPRPSASFGDRHELGKRYGVRKIRVFGSFARGEAGPDSDIDLVVEYVPGKGGFAFVEFCEEVEKLVGRKVDVVTENSLPPSIRDQVLAQAVPLR